MLRPATPLSVLLFAAFVLLLLSVLSTPIISAIPLGSWEGIDFGVFGFCTPNGCTPIEIGYDVREYKPHPMLALSNTRLATQADLCIQDLYMPTTFPSTPQPVPLFLAFSLSTQSRLS